MPTEYHNKEDLLLIEELLEENEQLKRTAREQAQIIEDLEDELRDSRW